MKTFKLLVLLFIGTCGLSFAQKANVHGDFPDPSIIKFGDYYYCSATSSNWQPGYPILKSSDLKNWEWVANIFPEKPDWVNNSFWAPELHVDGGRVYVYYTARKKNGGLCVAVASADKPEGPYKDHGPIVCEPVVGSIDGFAFRDDNDKLYFIWKTDGNSQRKPTPLWIQEMNEERTSLIGEPTEMFRNDMPWEGNLIEGPAVVKHGDYYYTFYAAAGCCGKGCTYKTGVARAKSLLGPWEKDPQNPIMVDEKNWKCQGHGTPIIVDDKNYLLYHGYSTETGIFTGRQGILREYVVTDDNWIAFTSNYIESDLGIESAAGTIKYFEDDFSGVEIKPSWNWSVNSQPIYKQSKGSLIILGDKNETPILFGQKIYSKNYQATLTIDKKSTATTGISLIGDETKNISLVVKDDRLWVTLKNQKEEKAFKKTVLNSKDKKLHLRILVKNNSNILFSYSNDGITFFPVIDESFEIGFLPPWDRAIRVGLYSKGIDTEKSIFNHFVLTSTEE